MQAIGNALTIVGIVVTFVAYFGQHSGVSLGDLEPSLTARWNRARGRVRQWLGRTTTVTATVRTSWNVSAAISATAMVWSPIQPDDDPAVRTDKLARNLDSLRNNFEECRVHDQQRLREIEDGLSKRLTALDQLVATRYEEGRQATTAAMRWEVRGLLITLVGAGMGILG